MKTLIATLVAFAALSGAVNAAPVASTQTDTVVEWGCGYGD